MKTKTALKIGIAAAVLLIITTGIFLLWQQKIKLQREIDILFEEQGLNEVIRFLEDHSEMGTFFSVAYLGADLDDKGLLISYQTTVDAFDDDYSYMGYYAFEYTRAEDETNGREKWIMDVSELQQGGQGLVENYNENCEIHYIDSQIKRLPLKEQISLLDFDHYYLASWGVEKLQAGEAIIDGTDETPFPLLELEEFLRGEGGTSDGATAIIISLSDGTGSTTQNMIKYRCKAVVKESLAGAAEYHMECDYYIDNNRISFTKDSGETWFQADISEEAVAKTLEFYGKGVEIPEDSYSLEPDSEAMAFFYGEDPILRVSFDDGQSWEDRSLPVGAFYEWRFTRRIVHFFDAQNGYAMLGTGHSMGTGKIELGFITHDGGYTWETITFPEQESGNLVNSFYFTESDMGEGIAALRRESDTAAYPTLYFTADGGKNWTPISIPEGLLPDNLYYLTKVCGFTKEDGKYVMIFRYETTRVKFISDSPAGDWTLDTIWEENIHTIG